MRANPEVLILEDDAETLDELQNHFARKRFHPLAARSAGEAAEDLGVDHAETGAGEHRDR